MPTDIKQLIPGTIYQALINANAPTIINPFATIADVTAIAGAYIPLAGNTVGTPITGDLIINEDLGGTISNLSGNSLIQFEDPSTFGAFSGAAISPGTLTGMAYSSLPFPIPSFVLAVGKPIKVTGTAGGVNDGEHIVTALEFSGGTNWIQWAGMTTELAAPYGEWTFSFNGIEFISSVIDPLGSKTASVYINPRGTFMRLNKDSYGQPGYLNGEVSIVDNTFGDYGFGVTYDSFPIVAAGIDYLVKQGVVSSLVGPGRQATVKTDYALYTENIAFNRNGGGTETLFTADKTTNVDRLITLPDADGIVVLTTDLGGYLPLAGGNMDVGGLIKGQSDGGAQFTQIDLNHQQTPTAFNTLVGGTGYTNPGANGVTTTTSGGGFGVTVDYTTNGAGVITSVVLIAFSGTGYLVGDTVTIDGGGDDATFIITELTSSGLSFNTNIGNANKNLTITSNYNPIYGQVTDSINFTCGTDGDSHKNFFFMNDHGMSMLLAKSDFSRIGFFSITENDTAATTGGFTNCYPAMIATKQGGVNPGIKNTVTLGGTATIGKTDEAAYVNKLIFNSGEAFETQIDYVTPTQDNLITFQNGIGTVAFLSDVQASDTLAEVLAIGNTTGGSNIVMTDEDLITSSNNTNFINLDEFGIGQMRISTPANEMIIDAGTFGVTGVSLLTLQPEAFGLSMFDSTFSKGGSFLMRDPSVTHKNYTSGNIDSFPIYIASNEAQFSSTVVNSVIAGGRNITCKTDDSLYSSKFILSDMAPTLPFTAVADAGGGQLTISAINTLSNGEQVRILCSTGSEYDGYYTVANVTGTTFEITNTFAATRAGFFGYAYETVLDHITPTADRLIQLQDGDGILAFLSDVQASDTLTEILANGNTTADGQTIQAENGGAVLDLRANSTDGAITLDGDTYIALRGGVVGVGIGSSTLSMTTVSMDFSYRNAADTKVGTMVTVNTDVFPLTTFNKPHFPTAFATQNGTVNSGVENSAIGGGINVIGKTDNTFYTNKIGFNGGAAFETIFEHITATQDNLITLPDASGTVVLSVAQTYTPTNVGAPVRAYDANSTSLDELADVVGTLIADLKTSGIIL